MSYLCSAVRNTQKETGGTTTMEVPPEKQTKTYYVLSTFLNLFKTVRTFRFFALQDVLDSVGL